MAVSVSNPADQAYYIVGTQKKTVRDVTFDSGYVTGGESVTAAELGLNYIDYATVNDISATGAGVNVANGKATVASTGATATIALYDETPAEVANAADVSTTVARVEAFGF